MSDVRIYLYQVTVLNNLGLEGSRRRKQQFRVPTLVRGENKEVYQTVILAYIRNISTRIISPWMHLTFLDKIIWEV
jgi:hypothetical protein